MNFIATGKSCLTEFSPMFCNTKDTRFSMTATFLESTITATIYGICIESWTPHYQDIARVLEER